MPDAPAIPLMNEGLSKHPNPAVRVRYGWKPDMNRGSQTGNMWADLGLNLFQQFVLPPKPQTHFSPGRTSPGMARRFGNEFYAQVAGRTDIATQLAQQRAQQQGLLGQIPQWAPEVAPYAAAVQQSLHNPEFRQALAPVMPYL